MDGQDRADRLVASILAVAMSGAVGCWLLRTSFDVGAAGIEAADATPLEIEFLTLPAMATHPRVATRDVRGTQGRPAPAAAVASEAVRVQATSPPSREAASQYHGEAQPAAGVTPPLDLHVHASTVVLPLRKGPFERTRTLDPRATRFESAWVAQTGALQTAAWRHPVLNAALHAFGGPPRHCSEVERRLLTPNCLPEPEGDPP